MKLTWYIGHTGNRYTVFSSMSTPTQKIYGIKYVRVYGPYVDVLRAKAEAMKFAGPRGIVLVENPVRQKNHAVEIYHDLEAIEATKSKQSLWPKGKFRHDFTKKGTKVLGLSDGSLLITNPKHRLWKEFEY